MRPGPTKIALAKLLNRELLPWSRSIKPEDISTNRRGRLNGEECSWSSEDRAMHIYGFASMAECVEKGITVSHTDDHFDVFALPQNPVPKSLWCFCNDCKVYREAKNAPLGLNERVLDKTTSDTGRVLEILPSGSVLVEWSRRRSTYVPIENLVRR